MQQQSLKFCGSCSRRVIEAWQGWPHRQPVPSLPKLCNGVCESCGEPSGALDSSRIKWFNYHGEYNTGLPDYWLLQVDGERVKWGLPYYSETPCTKCGSVVPVSEMRYPNGTSELKINCAACGVRSVR